MTIDGLKKDDLHHTNPAITTNPIFTNHYWNSTMKPLSGDDIDDTRCDHHLVRMPYLTFVRSFKMCLRPKVQNDLISDVIRRDGRWTECDLLLTLWREKQPIGRGDLFVDAGGNIGSCSLLMATAGANVITFEPVPSNLFYLTRGIIMSVGARSFPPERINVFPIGLGNTTATLPIYSEKTNKGISMVGKALNSASWDVNATITIFRLDDIMWPDPSKPAPQIRLLKVDVEGSEAKLLKGAHRLLAAKAIHMMMVEVSGDLLPRMGGSAFETCRLIQSYGYEICEEKAPSTPIESAEVCRVWDFEMRTVDIIARLKF